MKKVLNLVTMAALIALVGCGGGGAGGLGGTAAPGTTTPATSTWQALGSFADNSEWTMPQIRVYNNNGTAIPYVAYSNVDSGNLYIKKYVNDAWQAVGSTISCSISAGCDFDLFIYDDNGSPVPYIVYNNGDGGNGIGLIVQKYTAGPGWQTVGVGTTVQNAYYPALYVFNNIPYLAYINYDDSDNIYVKKYDGAWTVVGGGAALNLNNFLLRPGALHVESANEIYVGFSTIGGVGYIRKYDGGSWAYVQVDGSNSFSTTVDPNTVAMAISSGYIFLSYVDTADSYKAKMKIKNGVNWESYNISAGRADSISIAADSGIPYTLFTDWSASKAATVVEDTSTELGDNGFNLNEIHGTSISMFGDIPYVIFIDADDSNKVKVYKYE